MVDNRFMGLDVIESIHAVRPVPARVHTGHPRREAYHRRVQKKWLKRFGVVQKPALFIADLPTGGRAIILHPSLLPKLQEQLAKNSALANPPPGAPL